ncbi:MAG: DHH family phosphoesterase [Bacteroidales bacterium]|nr:DHH family phosphoesterase [Bacteroidales bacterium]
MNAIKDINETNIAALRTLLGRGERFVVTSHNSPDGDALGSTAALCHYLVSKGKEATLVLPDDVPDTLAFLFRRDDPFRVISLESEKDAALQAVSRADTLICLDFNTLSRTKLGTAIQAQTCPKILIDHHLKPQREAFTVCISETEISSACELLYHVLLALEGKVGQPACAHVLPSRTAYALMTGMTTDTNNFANSVFPSTLRMASELIAVGVDRDEIVSQIYQHYRENRLRALGYVLSEKLTLTPEGVAYVILSEEEQNRFGLKEGETESFVNQPLAIEQVHFSLFLKELPDRFRVSIRSKKGFSANRWAAECFHGGGHENASGGALYKPNAPADLLKGNAPDVHDVRSAEIYVKQAIQTFFKA